MKWKYAINIFIYYSCIYAFTPWTFLIESLVVYTIYEQQESRPICDGNFRSVVSLDPLRKCVRCRCARAESVVCSAGSGRWCLSWVWAVVFSAMSGWCVLSWVWATGGGWMICHFSNISVHFVFCQLNFIVLFPFLIKYYHIWFIIIVFWLGCDWPSCLLCIFPYLRLSSYLLRLFLYLISLLLFQCASVWENTRAWVPRFL